MSALPDQFGLKALPIGLPLRQRGGDRVLQVDLLGGMLTRLSDPPILMETVDAELPVKAKALLAYLTFTFPTARLHEQYELVRDFTRRLIVDPFEVATLLVQHAPTGPEVPVRRMFMPFLLDPGD
jgi:hypothetical protein